MSARVSGLAILLVVTLLSLPVLGQQASVGSCGVRGGTLKFAIHRDPIGLDPHVNYGATSSSLQGNVYDSLVEYDTKGRVGPALAESWSQPQPSVYVFKLRRNVTFHDGAPLTAADVTYSFQRIQDPQTKATRQRDLSDLLESVRTPDAYTVEVRLRQPASTFLDLLAGREMYIVSKTWAEGGGDFKKAMNGTGPYRLASYEPSVKYILERNPRAWNPPCLDRVELIPIQDDRARVNELKSGQVDFMEYLPWQETEYFFRERGYRVYRGYEVFNFVRLNPNRAPLNNPKVRQALNFAVNRQSVAIVAFGGQGQPMDGFLLRKDSWAYNPKTSKVWKYDTERALTLLREAGYQRPQDLRLTFESVSLSVHFDTAQVILQALRSLGITVDFRIIEVPVLLQKRTTGDYMMVMDGLSPPWSDPDAYFEYFHSSGAAYARGARFKHDRLDQLLEEGRRIPDQARRKEIYAEAERILAQEAPWIFLLWRPQSEVGKSYVKGYMRLPGGLGGTHTTAFFERLWVERP
ncbi:MAG: ABC transporter substrate-binding protein [Armatimonadota bacterium]